MSSFSDYLENELIDHIFGSSSYPRPASLYLELFNEAPNDAGASGLVVTGTGYPGRTAVTNDGTNFPAASMSGSFARKTNGVTYTIGTPSGLGWGVVKGVGFYDASTVGNFLAYAPLTAFVTASAGKRVKLLTGSFTITLSGTWTPYLATRMLDHVFGGPNYAAPTGSHFALFGVGVGAAELSGNGYARQNFANNTSLFPAASGGSKANASEITFGPASADWTQATRAGIYDNSVGGNLLVSSTLTTSFTVLNTETATFDSGTFTVSLS